MVPLSPWWLVDPPEGVSRASGIEPPDLLARDRGSRLREALGVTALARIAYVTGRTSGGSSRNLRRGAAPLLAPAREQRCPAGETGHGVTEIASTGLRGPRTFSPLLASWTAPDHLSVPGRGLRAVRACFTSVDVPGCFGEAERSGRHIAAADAKQDHTFTVTCSIRTRRSLLRQDPTSRCTPTPTSAS